MSAALILAGGLWFLIGMWPAFLLAADRGSFAPVVVWAVIGTTLFVGGVNA